MHEQNQTVKEQYLARIKNLNAEKEVLLKKNNELLNELRSIQPDKQQHQRYVRLFLSWLVVWTVYGGGEVRSVVKRLEELKNSKNEICCESRNVIKNVKAWVAEQKNINSMMVKREQELMQTIQQLSRSK